MKNKLHLFSLFIAAAVLLPRLSFAQEIKEMPAFAETDRVLVLAPHPDDEAIGAAGVIQKARKAGAKVRVACYTNGDHNQWAFIVYEKRLTVRKGEFLHMGEVRRKETLAAMASLGLGQGDVVFLGYPDFGTMEILTKYWGNTKPFKSILTRISMVSYPEALSFGAPYIGESILEDIKTVILDFRPTKIFVSHPADTNRDHRSLYLFLQVALWDLGGKIAQLQVFPYLIHTPVWPEPRGYHPDLELEPPEELRQAQWLKLPLTEEEIRIKHDAISFYRSQIEYNPPYLCSFARKNELFGDFPVIRLKKQDGEEICWQNLDMPASPAGGYVSQQGGQGDAETNQESRISALSYALRDDNLLIRLALKRKIDEDFGASIFLLGYGRNKNFADMPKIHLIIDAGGLRIRDKKQTLFVKDVRLSYEDEALIIKVPLSVLEKPECILSCANTHKGELPLDETAWRILELE